jgi:hypothetical protein
MIALLYTMTGDDVTGYERLCTGKKHTSISGCERDY